MFNAKTWAAGTPQALWGIQQAELVGDQRPYSASSVVGGRLHRDAAEGPDARTDQQHHPASGEPDLHQRKCQRRAAHQGCHEGICLIGTAFDQHECQERIGRREGDDQDGDGEPLGMMPVHRAHPALVGAARAVPPRL